MTTALGGQRSCYATEKRRYCFVILTEMLLSINRYGCERRNRNVFETLPLTVQMSDFHLHTLAPKTRKTLIQTIHDVQVVRKAKQSFYRAANAIFGKVGRHASEEVILQLVSSKCVPVLLYGLEACPLNKTSANSLDFVIDRFFYETV